jgi:hypothetical protein
MFIQSDMRLVIAFEQMGTEVNGAVTRSDEMLISRLPTSSATGSKPIMHVQD